MESRVADLSAAHAILLASFFAADASIHLLRPLTRIRKDIFDTEIILRIILSYLPESFDPSSYTSYLQEVGTLEYSELRDDDSHIDCAAVEHLSNEEARAKLKKLHLLHLSHPSISQEGLPSDPLTQFLVHRAHRIDSETGLVPLVGTLLQPFLGLSDYLRDWYAAAVLPLLRLEFEYYPNLEPVHSLKQFESLDGMIGLNVLLDRTRKSMSGTAHAPEDVARDLRGIVAPWVYGTQRWKGSVGRSKRRRLGNTSAPNGTLSQSLRDDEQPTEKDNPWHSTNEWLVSTAAEHFPLAVNAIENWDGPSDVDFGVDELNQYFQPGPDEDDRLGKEYCRAAFAAIYAVESDSSETIDGAHSILVRLASLLGFEPPPDLATSIHLLPQLESQSRQLEDTIMAYLQRDGLLEPDNPLTTPSREAFSLLQMFVYSAYLLSSLGHSWSIVKVTKLRFWSDDTEQLRLLQRILHGVVQGSKRDEDQWIYLRDTLRWLWDWAIQERHSMPQKGYGIFGKIQPEVLESEILQALCITNQYSLVTRIYLDPISNMPMPGEKVESVIINLALQYYDEASNGNRTRGGVRKASDLISTFQSHFPSSTAFSKCTALISATHALSFYSLTLQRGIPFKPASIRIQEDPVLLISHVLDQNPKSYTQLDNLIEIAKNLTKANVLSNVADSRSSSAEASRLLTAERRVTSMSIEAALSADDFETAYSYVVNRLSPPPTNPATSQPTDDVSWRAAYLAGRQRSKAPSSASSTSTHVRRLEQRMELLSQALLLAPPTHLPEILAAWRRCEEELLTLLAHENAAEQDFDDHADKRDSSGLVPGSFGEVQIHSVQPRRKELGRGAAEEAPMGLFEVMRGASAAIQRSAAGQASKTSERSSEDGDETGAGRQRKRDMVANAVTGGLASGIGWMLGATPVKEQDGL